MVKLTLTVAAVMTAAAVLADIGVTQPDSPHHRQFLRHAGPNGSGVGFGSAGSSPRDPSSSDDRDDAGSFRAGNRSPPSDAGVGVGSLSVGGHAFVGHAADHLWLGSGSLDDRFAPPSGASSNASPSWSASGKDGMPRFSDAGQGEPHRKALQKEGRDDQNAMPPMPSRSIDGPMHGGQQNEPPRDDLPNGRQPRNADSEPLRSDKPLQGDPDQPQDDKRVDSPHGLPGEHEDHGDQDDTPHGRDHLHRHSSDKGSWHGSGSVDGRFPPPPDAGGDEQQPPGVGGGRGVDGPRTADNRDDHNSPLSLAGSGSVGVVHDVGAGNGEVRPSEVQPQ
ncbi:hypothetical protein PHYSODRAFT_342409 [Phytophthora sojae]|uniref:RxLR effector protein n=1 Tax=Phytophthora sojae (strain P6497) TaxID=1094619 RepID=G5AGA8_PHYSP|nr:hypothetical protein PHYSODRAFT_342409 [Phytophthora sojae]EGZ05620.1 hypothetical protein PHYSODRAFT_342409 [Phytophthora sojae]|eukprot:XP_009539151.1 hypothetical protein PHYSODRAFT_342409 [Phytophthora sojae]